VEYEWDHEKDAENRRKHRLALADGISALEDPDAESWIDDRFAYGEERIVTLGCANARILLVVTTEPTEKRTRIISVRRAEKHEERWYYEGHS
jgi:uncharacterized DUF497 family protein